MKFLHKSICILMVIAILLPLCGCAAGNYRTEEEIFTKTIHDFEGHPVENLDEQENTNFVVYAKDVLFVTDVNEKNVLTSVDEENKVYIFEEPDDSLANIQEGDVFLADYRGGKIAIKVKSLSVAGSALTVYGDEVTMEDVLTYADVSMDVPLDALDFEEVDPESEIQVTDVNGPALQAPSTGYSLVKLSSTSAASVQAGKDISHNINVTLPGVKVTGKVGMTIHTVHINFRFCPEELFYSFSIQQDVTNYQEVKVEGAFRSTTPLSLLPKNKSPLVIRWHIFTIKVTPTINFSLSGSVSGSVRDSQKCTEGFSVEVSKGGGVRTNQIYQEGEPDNSIKLHEMEGKVSADLMLKMEPGVLNFDPLFGILQGSLECVGSVDGLVKDEESDESVHDCSTCIDGDINLKGKISVGIDLKKLWNWGSSDGSDSGKTEETENKKEKDSLLKKIGKNIKTSNDKYRLELVLWEEKFKIGDFYVSSCEEDVECGMGECPYLRWKTVLTVYDADGKEVANATAKATYPDGRTDEKMTDEGGNAVFYLPDGDNLLSCRHEGQSGKVNVYVVGEPTTAALRLDHQMALYVLYGLSKWDRENDSLSWSPEFDFPELYDLIVEKYPEAIFVNVGTEFDIITDGGDWGLSDDMFDHLNEEFEFALGDVILSVSGTDRGGVAIDYHYVLGEYVPVNNYSFLALSVDVVERHPANPEDLMDRSICSISAVVSGESHCLYCKYGWFLSGWSDDHPMSCAECGSVWTDEIDPWILKGTIRFPNYYYPSSITLADGSVADGYSYLDAYQEFEEYIINNHQMPAADAINSGFYLANLAQCATEVFPYLDAYIEDGYEGINQLIDERQANEPPA